MAHTAVERWAPRAPTPFPAARVYGTAAQVLAGLLLVDHRPDAAFAALNAALQSGADPASDPFLIKYASAFDLTVAVDGVTIELGMSRDLDRAAQLSRMHQDQGDLPLAVSAADQMSQSILGRVVKAGLAVDTGPPATGRHFDLATAGITNTDDLADPGRSSPALPPSRGIRKRYVAALEVLKAALHYPTRGQNVRHRARFERALVYKALGQPTKARGETRAHLRRRRGLPRADRHVECAGPGLGQAIL